MNITSKRYRRLAISASVIALLLTACSEPAQWPSVELTQAQVEKYQASCMVCHESTQSGAPIRGGEQWQEIMQKPVESVLNNVVEGINGMPPLGQCFDCDEQDLKALMYFLAQANIP